MSEGRHLLGQIAMLESDPATAADCFAQARLLNPDDLLLLEELAWAQFAAGSFSQTHAQIENRLKPQVSQHTFVTRLRRAVPCKDIFRHRRTKGMGNQGTGS